MCFQLHSSHSVRLCGTEAQAAQLVSSALLGGGALWREHTSGARVANPVGRFPNGKAKHQNNPAGLYVGFDRQIDSIPTYPSIEMKGAGL